MISIQSFVFGPFQENTYILSDETKECIIIDPGCFDSSERNQLAGFIDDNKLIPVKLINTHCHLDHVFGNGFIAKKYNLQLEINKRDKIVLDNYLQTARIYNVPADPSPEPSVYLEEGDIIKFGSSSLEILLSIVESEGASEMCSKSGKLASVGH